MTEVNAIHVDGRYNFTVFVFCEDSPSVERFWAFVKHEEDSADAGWLGCWSSKGNQSGADVNSFLQRLILKIEETAVSGPLGPWLGGHYFFDDWDTWGPGIPSPLVGVITRDNIENAHLYRSLGEFNRRKG